MLQLVVVLGLSMDNCTTYPLVSQCPCNSVRSRLGKFSYYHWLLKLYNIWPHACPSVYNQICSVSTDHHIEGLSFEDFVGQIFLIFTQSMSPRGSLFIMIDGQWRIFLIGIWWDKHAVIPYKASKADGSNQQLPGLVGTLWAMCFR